MPIRKLINRIVRHRWVHPQSVLVFLVSAFMLFLILFSGGQSEVTGSAMQPASASPNSALLIQPRESNPLEKLAVTPTPSAYPEPEYAEQQMGGIILAAALVVLVIVGGSMFSINRRK